jgi:hypothetical protein
MNDLSFAKQGGLQLSFQKTTVIFEDGEKNGRRIIDTFLVVEGEWSRQIHQLCDN